MMYEILLKSHSVCAFMVILSLAISCVNSFVGYFMNRQYTSTDLRIHLFTLIFTHTQMVIGAVLYFVSPLFLVWDSGMKSVMKNANVRLFLVEHPIMMILSVVLITIGWLVHKKQKSSKGAFGKIAIFYTFGLFILLLMVPWNRWIA